MSKQYDRLDIVDLTELCITRNLIIEEDQDTFTRQHIIDLLVKSDQTTAKITSVEWQRDPFQAIFRGVRPDSSHFEFDTNNIIFAFDTLASEINKRGKA